MKNPKSLPDMPCSLLPWQRGARTSDQRHVSRRPGVDLRQLRLGLPSPGHRRAALQRGLLACKASRAMTYPWRIHGAAIHGNMDPVPSIYPQYVSIYTSTMDPMGDVLETVPRLDHLQENPQILVGKKLVFSLQISPWTIAASGAP